MIIIKGSMEHTQQKHDNDSGRVRQKIAKNKYRLRKIFSRGIGLVLLIIYMIRRILQKTCLGLYIIS